GFHVTGVQTCALPICSRCGLSGSKIKTPTVTCTMGAAAGSVVESERPAQSGAIGARRTVDPRGPALRILNGQTTHHVLFVAQIIDRKSVAEGQMFEAV